MSGGFSNKGPTGSSGLTAAETLWVQSGNGGILLLTEQSSAPSATANVGKVYTKSSDSLLYFKTDGGVEYLISGGGSGHTIQDEGTPLTARTNLNFVGAGVTVTDGGAGPNSTIVTVTGGGDVVGPASATDNAIVRFDLTTGKLIQNSTVTIGDTGAIVNTIADTSNVVALTITQNDITNNPRGIVVTNAGTGQAIRVVANGNTGTSASTSGAIFLDNTNNIGTGGNFYTNGATVGTTGVLFAKVDNAAASGPVVRIDNDGTGNALKINANGNVGTSFSGSGALLIDNTLNTGFGLNIYSNVGAAVGPLARIYAANASFDQPTLQITNNGTSGGAASIRIDGVSPQIEMVEDDQVTPAGKYELQVQGDRFFINGRNSADTSFETIVIVDRVGNSNLGRTSFAGPIAPITTDGAAIGTTSLMWSDVFLATGAVLNFNAGNATLTHSASLLTSSVDIVVPAEVYGVAWNGSNEAPTKNDVYDRLQLSSTNLYTTVGDSTTNFPVASYADIGAAVNAAYASLPTEGGTIFIQNGIYSFTTPIVFGTNAKIASLIGSSAASLYLKYTPTTGNAITLNHGDISGRHRQHEIGNFTLMGTSSFVYSGTANTRTSVGLFLGGTNGCPALNVHNITINGFGTQIETAANFYMASFNHLSLSGGNGVNGTGTGLQGSLVHINSSSNSGERMVFSDCTFADPCNSEADNAFYVESSGSASLVLDGCSIDNCQVRVLGPTLLTIINSHIENPNATVYGEYTPVYIDSYSSGSTSFISNEILDSCTDPAKNFPAIIKHGGNLYAAGNHISNFGGQTIAVIFDNSLNSAVAKEYIVGTVVEGGNVTNVVNGFAYTAAAAVSTISSSNNGGVTATVTNTDGSFDIVTGGSLVSQKITSVGDMTTAGDITLGDQVNSAFISLRAGNTRVGSITQIGTGATAPLRINTNGSMQLEVDAVAVMTISDVGLTTFAQTVSVPDDAYNAGSWDGNLTVPTKNAIRDKIESISGGTGLTWSEVTGTSQAAAVNNAYICNNVALVTVTIPTTAPVGSVVRVVGKGAGGWKVAQNASESINFVGLTTTVGTGGSIASTIRYDSVEIVCTVADTTWNVKDSVGNLTIV